MEREVRNLQHSKQKTVSVKSLNNIDKNELTEGVAQLRYIKGRGLYWVVKYNNQVYYNEFSTLG